jgi:hypothetical protein
MPKEKNPAPNGGICTQNAPESKRTQFMRWWMEFGNGRGMDPAHAAWIAWLERDRLAE